MLDVHDEIQGQIKVRKRVLFQGLNVRDFVVKANVGVDASQLVTGVLGQAVLVVDLRKLSGHSPLQAL